MVVEQRLSAQSVTGRQVQAGKRRLGSRLAVLLSLGWLVAAAAGCVSVAPFLQSSASVLTPPACKVVATWYPQVVTTPDPTHDGEPVHGLAGRVYLFGADLSHTVCGDGALIVDLYDDTSEPKRRTPLEEWRFDKDTLRRLQRADAVGPGYTVFLPWGTYRPEIHRVHLRVRYEPVDGTPLYDENPPMTLRKGTNVE